MQQFTLPRRLAAEMLGTGFLVAAVVGSGIMATRLTDDIGLALLANTIATGAILAVLIAILGPVSAAHFNPAVSLVMAIRGMLTLRELPWYVIAQILGGLAGTSLAHMMFGLRVFEISANARTGAAQWLSEGVATFGLTLVILCGIRFQRASVSWLVGLYIVAAYWFTASTSFANPAVAVARSLTNTFAGIRPDDLPGFILAELAGALLAAAFVRWLLHQNPVQESAEL